MASLWVRHRRARLDPGARLCAGGAIQARAMREERPSRPARSGAGHRQGGLLLSPMADLVPLIDLSRWPRGRADERRAIAAALDEAASRIGSFQITGHG